MESFCSAEQKASKYSGYMDGAVEAAITGPPHWGYILEGEGAHVI
jgi:hypothetical protein